MDTYQPTMHDILHDARHITRIQRMLRETFPGKNITLDGGDDGGHMRYEIMTHDYYFVTLSSSDDEAVVPEPAVENNAAAIVKRLWERDDDE